MRYAPAIAISLLLPLIGARCNENSYDRHYEVADEWVFLGSRSVDYGGDHDRIEIGRREGRFRRLQFRVTGGDIELYDMRVRLADGTTVDLNMRHRFERGSVIRDIDLPGDRRVIHYVDFRYRALRGRPTVQLYGR